MLSTFLIKKTDRLELALVRSRSPRAPVCSWYLGDWFLRNNQMTEIKKVNAKVAKKEPPIHKVRLFGAESFFSPSPVSTLVLTKDTCDDEYAGTKNKSYFN